MIGHLFCYKNRKKQKTLAPERTRVCSGASDEARTRYLHLGKVALYQMSYTRSNGCYYSTRQKKVKGYFEKI